MSVRTELYESINSHMLMWTCDIEFIKKNLISCIYDHFRCERFEKLIAFAIPIVRYFRMCALPCVHSISYSSVKYIKIIYFDLRYIYLNHTIFVPRNSWNRIWLYSEIEENPMRGAHGFLWSEREGFSDFCSCLLFYLVYPARYEILCPQFNLFLYHHDQ